MATGTLTGQTIANTYKSLLKITGTTAGGETLHATTQKIIEDGDGNPFPLSAAADALMITSTNRLEFGDNASYIHQSADGVLDLVSDTEIELNATTIDINGAVDMSSTLTVADDVNFDSNTLFVDASENRVGIGTNAPQKALHILDNDPVIRISDGNSDSLASATPHIEFYDRADSNQLGLIGYLSTGDGILTINNKNNASMNFKTNNTTALTIDNAQTSNFSGKVGIDTSSPQRDFVISNGGAGGMEFGAGDTASIISLFNRSNSSYTELDIEAKEVHFLTGTSPAEKMRIDSSGNVGIGSAPNNHGGMQKTLEVFSSAGDVQIAMHSTADNMSDGARIGELAFLAGSDSTVPNVATIVGRVSGTDENKGQLSFHTRASDTGGLPTERMRIASDGKVCIGDGSSTAPREKLDVRGDAVIGDDGGQSMTLMLRARTGDNRKTHSIISPSKDESNDGFTQVIGMDNQSSSNELSIGSNTGSYKSPTVINMYTATAVDSGTNNKRMAIFSDGNVGIGKHSSGNAVDSSANQLKIYDDSSGTYAVHIEQNQGDGLCLDLFASASDDHNDDAIFRARTDAQTLFQIFNNGNTDIDGNLTVNNAGSSSSIMVDGNTGSGNDGTLLLKGHTSSNSRAYVYFNNGADSSSGGGQDWYLGALRGINSFGLSTVDDANTDSNAFTVDSSKRFGIGTYPDATKFHVKDAHTNAPLVKFEFSGGGGELIRFITNGTPNGNIVEASGNVAYNTSYSDRTLKKNFTSWTENVLDSFDNINPQLFHYKTQDDSEEKKKGFIAQEMIDKFPEAYPLVSHEEGDEQTQKYYYNPSGMVVYLMKAVQELSAKVTELENKLGE